MLERSLDCGLCPERSGGISAGRTVESAFSNCCGLSFAEQELINISLLRWPVAS